MCGEFNSCTCMHTVESHLLEHDVCGRSKQKMQPQELGGRAPIFYLSVFTFLARPARACFAFACCSSLRPW